MKKRTRTLRIETLENREMLSVSTLGYDPSPEAQEMLELINRMRTDPQGEFDRLFHVNESGKTVAKDSRVQSAIDYYRVSIPQLAEEWDSLSSAAPLAWSSALSEAAMAHSRKMLQYKTQNHQLPGELPLFDRIIMAGFEPDYSLDSRGNSRTAVAENIYAYGHSADQSFTAASFTHAAFAIDWGVPDLAHRTNLMDSYFNEVGIFMLYEEDPFRLTPVGDWITTIDFGRSESAANIGGGYLTGVIYNDINGNGYFEAYEGLGGITVLVQNIASGESLLTSSMTAGGYQILLPDGTYDITVSGEGFSVPLTKRITIAGANTKADFRIQEISEMPPVVDLNGPNKSGNNSSTTYYEGTPGAAISLIGRDMTITDPDSHLLYSAEIYLWNRPDGQREVLGIDTAGTLLSANFNSATGVLLLSGTASLADYEKVLRTLTYSNYSEIVDLEDRTVCVSVSDGIHSSEISTVTIHIEPAVLPQLTVFDATVVEGDEPGRTIDFLVRLSEPARREVVLRYQLINGTAVAGTDFMSPETLSISILPGQSEAIISIPIYSNYTAQSDRAFSLWVTELENAVRDSMVATGTIRDDDNIIALGGKTGWRTTNLDLSDMRALYSFTPKNDVLVTWEAIDAKGTAGVSIVLFEGSHDSVPLTGSMSVNGTQTLQRTLRKGVTYVVLVEGNTTLDVLRMTQKQVPKDDKLEFDIPVDADRGVDIVFDEEGVVLDIPGNDPVRYDPLTFAFLFLNTANPDIPVKITSKNPVVDSERGIVIIDGIEIDLSRFKDVTLYGTDGYDTAQLFGTSGDDHFMFSEGVGVLTTSKGQVYRLVNYANLEIDGGGGNDTAVIYDTPKDDYFYFGNVESESGIAPGIVEMIGGGYHVKVQSFENATVSSLYGGNDHLVVAGKNGSIIYLNEIMTRRVEFQEETLLSYVGHFFRKVTVSDDDTNNPSSIKIQSGARGNQYIVSPGHISVTDDSGSFKYEISGTANVAINSNSPGKDYISISDKAKTPVFANAENGALEYAYSFGDNGYTLKFSESARYDYFYRESLETLLSDEINVITDMLLAAEDADILAFNLSEIEEESAETPDSLLEEFAFMP